MATPCHNHGVAGEDGKKRGPRWSSLSSRIALLIALLLVLSGLVTAVYSAASARRSSTAASAQSMANLHEASALLIGQAYADAQKARATALEARKAELRNVAAPIAASLEEIRERMAATPEQPEEIRLARAMEAEGE